MKIEIILLRLVEFANFFHLLNIYNFLLSLNWCNWRILIDGIILFLRKLQIIFLNNFRYIISFFLFKLYFMFSWLIDFESFVLFAHTSWGFIEIDCLLGLFVHIFCLLRFEIIISFLFQFLLNSLLFLLVDFIDFIVNSTWVIKNMACDISPTKFPFFIIKFDGFIGDFIVFERRVIFY